MTATAAEQIRWLLERPGDDYNVRLVDEALAAERRATVERILTKIAERRLSFSDADWDVMIVAILDEEAAR